MEGVNSQNRRSPVLKTGNGEEAILLRITYVTRDKRERGSELHGERAYVILERPFKKSVMFFEKSIVFKVISIIR